MPKRPFISLMLRHAELERRLREERTRALPDGAKISQLKKLKLAVKDRLQRLSAGQGRAVRI